MISSKKGKRYVSVVLSCLMVFASAGRVTEAKKMDLDENAISYVDTNGGDVALQPDILPEPVLVDGTQDADVVCTTGQNYGVIEMPWDVNVPVADEDITVEQVDAMIDGGSSDYGRIRQYLSDGTDVGVDGELEAAYPASCDSQEEILAYLQETMPATRDQASYGTCWAQSSVALSELYAITQQEADRETIDYSERHLVRYSYGEGTAKWIEKTGDEVATSNDADADEVALLIQGGNVGVAAQALIKYHARSHNGERRYIYG